MKVKFSIIITCYNRRKFIGRCVRSAINQHGISRDSYEVLVIDDCSTDNSLKIIKEYENLIKLIKNSRNLGLPASRNKGIKKSKGEYFYSYGTILGYIYSTLYYEFDRRYKVKNLYHLNLIH